jgi:tetraacyldisaccharide 4'-kinase
MEKPRDYFSRLWSDRQAAQLNPLRFLLFLSSLLYAATVRIRASLYRFGIFRHHRLSRPVISVGNLTVGGTGKTPAVISLAAFFKSKGFRPAVLSRGYAGRSSSPVNVVSDGEHVLAGPEQSGDEPSMMAASLPDIPVLTGRKRFLSGMYAIDRLSADVLILDDGFQHLGLERDFEVVLLNADAPFGNGYLIPRGPLRESKQALKRADAIVLTGAEGASDNTIAWERDLQSLCPDIPVLKAVYHLTGLIKNKKERYPVEFLNDKRVLAFCGIANPGSFRRSLENAGACIDSFIVFPDHYHYSEKDIQSVCGKADAVKVEMIVTTEKDGVKLTGYPDFFQHIFLLRIHMDFLPEGKLEKIIEDRIRR